MKDLGKTLILIVILQIVIMFILVLPTIIIFAGRISRGIVFEVVTSLTLFTISLFISIATLKVKSQNLNFNLLGIGLAAVYFALGISSLFLSGFSVVKIIGYPILAFLTTSAYLHLKKQKL